MIELAAAPVARRVTARALLAELPGMNVIATMTGGAAGGGLAPRLGILVTAIATENAVRALEREIGLPMIELPPVQAHNVGVAAQMFAVTGRALTRAGVRHQPMIAAVLVQVGGDVLMTRQAQLVLARPVAAIVACPALLFGFCVPGNDLTRLEQRLDRGGMRADGPEAK